MPSLNFDAECEAFSADYRSDERRLREAASSFAALIQLLLSDATDFATPSVSFRVKEREECISKFKRKYLAQCERDQSPFEIRPFITDLIGVRVLCLYETELHAIADVLSKHFKVESEADKSQQLDSQESEFGYKALHLDLRLNGPRSLLTEYSRFIDLQFEVQIRTAIQDAWSTLDHKIKYKKSIPVALKRRINRLAALFELADQEFLFIRNETRKLEADANEVASISLTIEGQGIGIGTTGGSAKVSLLNAAEFIAICRALSPGYPFDPAKADVFVQELLAIQSDLSASTFRGIIETHRAIVERYRDHQLTRMLVRMNPYTVVRHILYLQNRNTFREFLFDHQRRTFQAWLDDEVRTGAASDAV